MLLKLSSYSAVLQAALVTDALGDEVKAAVQAALDFHQTILSARKADEVKKVLTPALHKLNKHLEPLVRRLLLFRMVSLTLRFTGLAIACLWPIWLTSWCCRCLWYVRLAL